MDDQDHGRHLTGMAGSGGSPCPPRLDGPRAPRTPLECTRRKSYRCCNALAEIDSAHESDVEAVRGSGAEEWLKQTVIPKLEVRHRERRAPYVRQLEAVEERIWALAA